MRKSNLLIAASVLAIAFGASGAFAKNTTTTTTTASSQSEVSGGSLAGGFGNSNATTIGGQLDANTSVAADGNNGVLTNSTSVQLSGATETTHGNALGGTLTIGAADGGAAVKTKTKKTK